MRFCHLVALRQVGSNANRQALWECRCDCGNIVITSGYALRTYQVKSCGCKRGTLRYQQYRTRLFRIWWGIKLRCEYPSKADYKYYGAKGIKICKEWQTFAPFREWALSHGYNDNLTIDRIDVKGDYCPENCQWLTLEENKKKGFAERDYSKWGKHKQTKTKLYSLHQGRKKDMCDEWQDFMVFKKWADQNGYVDGLKLIRIDYSLPISPDNCKFGTQKEKYEIIMENRNRLNMKTLYENRA